jgi:hypothetical protein
VETDQAAELRFFWNPKSVSDGSKGKDQIMMLAYDLVHDKAIWISTGQFRETGQDKITLEKHPGCTYHVYVAFVADDRNNQSDSVYLGAFTTAPLPSII